MNSHLDFYPLPQPHEVSKREKDDAMGAYLMMFAALGAGLPLPMINLIASIIYTFVNLKKGRFVRFHLLQSLWSQLPLTLLNGYIVIWTIRNFVYENEFSSLFFGLLWTAVIANIIYVAFSIYAAIQASKGRIYYFLFFGKIAYYQVFKIKEDSFQQDIEENLPPM
jgi:uncharacterized membrane protein